MATQQFSNHALYVYKGVLSKRVSLLNLKYLIALVFHAPFTGFKYCFHSGKLSVDWNGQENFSLSCELWVGTNDFNTKSKKNFLVRSNPRIIFLSGN
jgi:hypothetical protein